MKDQKKHSKKTAIESFSFGSMQQCESATGIPKSILQTAKADGSLAFRNSRIYFLDLIRWLFKSGHAKKVNWSEINKQFDARLKQIEIARHEGELIMKTEVQELVQFLMGTCTNALKSMSIEFPKTLEMRSAVEIKALCGPKYWEIIGRMRQEFENWNPEAASPVEAAKTQTPLDTAR